MHLPGFLDINEKNLLPKEGVLEYVYPFYSAKESQLIFNSLIDTISWEQQDMLMYDRVVLLPRLTAHYGPQDKWLSVLKRMQLDVERHTKLSFNTVYLNLYRDQNDHVSWHADRENHPGDTDIIVSLSFGEARRFQVKHRDDSRLPVQTILLHPGSMVIMRGGMQKKWLHRISKETKPMEPRINLTYRNIHY